MEKKFIQNEIEKLITTGWITNSEGQEYLNKPEIINAINASTSPIKVNIFNALKLTPYDKAKVLILGQDPYPNPLDAHGLAFSSKNSVTPGSLKNIFIAIDNVYNSNLYKNKYNELTSWANQGVLLLNTSLTFEKKDDKKLQQQIQNYNFKLWKPFVNLIITKLLMRDKPFVMLLWGDKAQKIVEFNIKKLKNNLNENILILKSTHPSPLSVNRGGDFPTLAPEHFKECNKFLNSHNLKEITWGTL